SIGQGVRGSRRFLGLRSGMDAHVAEVEIEARFHKCPRLRIERLSGEAQHVMDDGRSRGVGTGKTLRLQLRVLMSVAGPTFFTSSSAVTRAPHAESPCEYSRCRRAQFGATKELICRTVSAKHDVRVYGVGLGLAGVGRFGRGCAGMNPDTA